MNMTTPATEAGLRALEDRLYEIFANDVVLEVEVAEVLAQARAAGRTAAVEQARPILEKLADTMDRSPSKPGARFADLLREAWREAFDTVAGRERQDANPDRALNAGSPAAHPACSLAVSEGTVMTDARAADPVAARLLHSTMRSDSGYSFKFNHRHRDETVVAHDVTDLCSELRVVPAAAPPAAQEGLRAALERLTADTQRLFDHIDEQSAIEREKMISRDPMRQPRGVIGVTASLWDNFLRTDLAAAIEQARAALQASSPAEQGER